MLALLYLIAHIDRANIGNAKIEGLTEDLNLTGVQYNIVLSICMFTLLSPRFHSQLFTVIYLVYYHMIDIRVQKAVLTRGCFYFNSFSTLYPFRSP